FVHFITFGDNGRRRGQLNAYLKALTSGHSSEEAFQTAADALTVAAAEALQGTLLVSVGGLEDADRRLTAALADHSGYLQARVWHGALRLRQERYDDALGLLQAAATEAP